MKHGIKVRSNLDDPFIRVPQEADDVDLGPYEFRIYSRLIRRAGEDGVAWQSVPNMAKECKMSPRKAHDALAELERRNMITGFRRSGQTTEYTINKPTTWKIKPVKRKPAKRTPAPPAEVEADTPAPHARAETDTPAPPARAPLHHMQGTPAPGADKGDPTNKNPMKENPKGAKKKTRKFDPLKVDLPDSVSQAAWSEFAQHRREIRKTLTPTATARLLKGLADSSDADARLRQSVENGWTGVFEISGGPTQKTTSEDSGLLDQYKELGL